MQQGWTLSSQAQVHSLHQALLLWSFVAKVLKETDRRALLSVPRRQNPEDLIPSTGVGLMPVPLPGFLAQWYDLYKVLSGFTAFSCSPVAPPFIWLRHLTLASIKPQM